MNCILCKNKGRLIIKDFAGVVYHDVKGNVESIKTDRAYDIWHCDVCDIRYVTPHEFIDYEKVYTKTNVYDGLSEFAEKIKDDSDPWWTLIGRGQQYYAALDFVKGKKLKILDIGCGYGYMVCALNSLGHYTLGTEVSESVVKKAKELYGNAFYHTDIKGLKVNEKVDLVMALEVIEHVPNPLEFMKTAKDLIKDDGSILITTPSKEYFEEKKTSKGKSMLTPGWAGEMPPVHLSIWSKKTMEWLAKELDMKLTFTDFPGGLPQTIGAIFTK